MGGRNSTERLSAASERFAVYSLIVLVLLIPPFFIFFFELLKKIFFASIPSWKSSLLTDLFIGFSAALPALFIAHKAIVFIRRLETGEQKQKKIENDLHSSETKFSALFQTCPAALVLIDAETATPVDINKAFTEQFGWSFEEVVGKNTLGTHLWADPSKRHQFLERLKTEGHIDQYILDARTKEGKRRVHSLSADFVAVADKTYFLLCGYDITEHLDNENKLKASEQRFKTLTHSAPIGIALVNKDNSAAYINPHFTSIMGYTLEDLQVNDNRWYELAYPDPEYRKNAMDDWRDAQKNPGITERTFRVCCKNRQYKIIHFCTTPLNDGRMLLTCEDVTDQRRIQDALRDSEEQLRLALECGNIALIDYDFEKESIYLSPEYFRQLGYSSSEIIITRQTWPDLIHPEDRPKAVKLFEDYLAGGGKGYYEAVYRMKAKDGLWKWIFDRGGVVRWNAQGNPSRMIGVHIDVTARKQAEESLRESERRMTDIIDFLPDATFAIDRDGKVLAWNRAMAEMTGRTKEEMLGQGHHAYAVPFYGSSRPILIDLVFKDCREIESQYRYVTRRNDFLYAEVHAPLLHKHQGAYLWGIAAPLYDEKGQVVGAIESIRDITDRRQAENALREALEKRKEMEFIISHSPVTLWLWKASPDWPVEYVSENVAMFGYSPEDFTSGRVLFSSIIHTEDVARVGAEVEQHTKEDRHEFTQEYRLVTKSGEVRWVDDRTWIRRDSNGQISHYQGIIVDITDRKKTDEALKESEVRYRTFINSTTDMAYVKDDNFKHLIANQALLDFFGKTEKEVIGKTDFELMPRAIANACRATDEEAKRSGHVVVSEEYAAGKYYETYKFPVSIGHGKKGVGGYIRDITYRKRAEEVIQNYQKELRELASQLSLTEEKQRRAIATELHDGIGQLLSMSKLRLQQVLKRNPDPVIRTEIEDALSMLLQALQDSRSLIFQLSPPILYELGFVPAVEWLVEQFQTRHNSIHFSCETGNLQLDLPLDTRIILFQATRELLYNIVKHAEAKNAWISIEQDFGSIHIVVSDDGKGYTAHLKTRDSGFGLFSIHERLAHFGGRLEITGNPGKGTQVVISTPVKMPEGGKK